MSVTLLYATGLLSLPVLLRKRKLQFMSSLLGSKNGVVAYVSSVKWITPVVLFSAENGNCVYHTRVFSRQSRSILQDFWNYSVCLMSEARCSAAVLAHPWLSKSSCKGRTADLFSLD